MFAEAAHPASFRPGHCRAYSKQAALFLILTLLTLLTGCSSWVVSGYQRSEERRVGKECPV